MSRHYRFIRGSSPRRSTTADSALTAISDVLQCDKVSWFCHIEALTLRFVVQDLIVSDDTGSSAVATNDEINVKRLRSSYCEVGTSERMSMDRTRTRLAAAGLVLSALALGGCSIPIADLPSIGTTADAPGKQADPYLPVEDLPPGRDRAHDGAGRSGQDESRTVGRTRPPGVHDRCQRCGRQGHHQEVSGGGYWRSRTFRAKRTQFNRKSGRGHQFCV